MFSPSRAWFEKATTTVAIAGALYYIAAFVTIAILRIRHPFSLEWLEGGSYVQVHRILTGLPLYTRPSMQYVAMIYPPFYYYVSAVLSRLLGFGLLPLRLVSFAASLGCTAAIYLICRREGRSRVPALLASGVFASTYHLSGNWFDIGRVDMLSVFLLLCAIWLLGFQSPRAHAGAGILFALACLTKQTHLLTLACISIYLVVFDRRRLVVFAVSCFTILGMAFLLLDRLYSGWFTFFVVSLALGSREYVSFAPSMILETALDFWSGSILLALPVVIFIILIFLFVEFRQRAGARKLYFYLTLAAGMVGTSWSVVQVGGYKNDLVPAYAIIAIFLGLSLQGLCYRQLAGSTLRGVYLTACAFQFALLIYPVAPQIPSREDQIAGEALVREIRAQPGPVYVPFHPEIALMAGKDPYASWSPMYQLEGNYGGGNIRETGRVKTEFTNAMSRQEFSMIILDQDPNWIWGNPEMSYSIDSRPVFLKPGVFWPVTGWQTRPEIRMFPKPK